MAGTPVGARSARRRATTQGGVAAGRSTRDAVAPPVLVEVQREGIVESRHRGHIVQVGADGRVERGIGDPEVLVTLRSAVKPFTLVALVESGAADALRLNDAELAVMAASHAGEDLHVRTLQGVFRRAGISQNLLACGAENMPLDALTAARLARDGEDPGPIRHMCSGFHAASIMLSRHAGWSLDDYHDPDHPSQVAARGAVARVFAVSPATLRTAVDGCGLLTYAFPLVDVARAFALLADPLGAAPDAGRALLAPALTRVRDAMMAHPELVGGTRDMIDTVLMKALPGRIVVKGGAEALRGVGLLPGARGERTPAAGMAVKIEDGDGFGRANRAATVEALAQLGVISERELRLLARHHRPPVRDPRGELTGEAVPGFELAPISELV
jgi:L-asparaginase II